VCPFNQNLTPWAEKHRVGYVGPGFDLLKILALSEDEWQKLFSYNQIGIRERSAIIKNAIISLGYTRATDAIPALVPYLTHKIPLIRVYTAWALGRMDSPQATKLLAAHLANEKEELVRKEIKTGLVEKTES